MRYLNVRLAVMILIILIIGLLGYFTREAGSLNWLIENEDRTRTFVREHPWQSWMMGLGAYVLFSLIPGTSGKSVVWGWIFGFWPAVLIVDIGLTTAAMTSFLAARYLMRDIVRGRFHSVVQRIDESLDKDAAFYLIMIRLAHVPFTLVNYAAGATSVPTRTFVWTTALGLVPGTMVFVFVGTRIPTLAAIAEKGVWQLVDPLLAGLLAATVVFPVLMRWAVNAYRQRAADKVSTEQPLTHDSATGNGGA